VRSLRLVVGATAIAAPALHSITDAMEWLHLAWDARRSSALPRFAVRLFGAGLLIDLGLALAPTTDILQTVGTALRNAGIVGIGYALLFGSASSKA
jgi:hypothetical protein